MICFSLFVGAPAYRLARRIYREDARYIVKDIPYVKNGSRSQRLDVYILKPNSHLFRPSSSSSSQGADLPPPLSTSSSNIVASSTTTPVPMMPSISPMPILPFPGPTPSVPNPESSHSNFNGNLNDSSSGNLNVTATANGGSSAKEGKGSPVVLFVQGGGWTLCQKAVYPAVGRALRARGFITVIPDYTAFPQGDAELMVQDLKACIAWTIGNIENYGGNPSKIILCGVSAGAHLSSLTLLTELESCLKKSQVSLPTTTDMNKSKSAPTFSSLDHQIVPDWPYSGIRALIAISGPFNVPLLYKNMQMEGKERFSGLEEIMRGKENFEKYSPHHVLRDLISSNNSLVISTTLPPVTLIHGSRDKTCPIHCAVEFDKLLRQAGVHGKLTTYESQSHTESMMEVLDGVENARLILDIVRSIQSGTIAEPAEDKPPLSWRFRRLIMRSLSPV